MSDIVSHCALSDLVKAVSAVSVGTHGMKPV